eukprot:3406096-Ditylum_brightwellii.AAC.1
MVIVSSCGDGLPVGQQSPLRQLGNGTQQSSSVLLLVFLAMAEVLPRNGVVPEKAAVFHA